MKKVFFSALILVCVMMIIAAADFRRLPLIHAQPLRPCGGYTIIEYDKGLDCNGDTIRLVRTHGYAERVVH